MDAKEATPNSPETDRILRSRDPIYSKPDPREFAFQADEGDAVRRDIEAIEGLEGRKQNLNPEGGFDDHSHSQSTQDEANRPLDVQATVRSIQDLVRRIRENLEGEEQKELEDLLRQGTELLSTHYKALSLSAKERVEGLKAEAKENPFSALMSALRIGMALSQVYYEHAQLDKPSGKARSGL